LDSHRIAFHCPISAGSGRRRAPPTLLATWPRARRRLNLVQLIARSADLPDVEHLADRASQLGPFGNDGLTWLKKSCEPIGFRRRQAQNGAVVEQGAVHIAARAVQGHPNGALHFRQSG
jgi:hypothetical protein